MKPAFYQALLGSLVFLFSFEVLALKVVIDAGHGGTDVGASRHGVNESAITLRVAKMLQEKLSHDSRIQSFLTRDSDKNMGLQERVDFAHARKADLFLSIHVNASADRKAKGAEFYFQNQLEPNEAAAYLAHQENQLNLTEETPEATHQLVNPAWPASLKAIFFDLLNQSRVRESFLLSKSLRENWQGHRKPKSLSLKQAPFHVVSRTHVPSTLVELGFLTNTQDLKSLQNEAYLQTAVESLYRGLLAFQQHAP